MPGLYINSIWFKTFKSWDLKGEKGKGWSGRRQEKSAGKDLELEAPGRRRI